MSELHKAMQLLMETFYEYSTGEGDSGTMTMSEVSLMLRSELKGPIFKEDIEEYFHNLDLNGDGVVIFKEFVAIVTDMALIVTDLDISKLSEDFKEQSKLLQSMKPLMGCFKLYSTKEGNPHTMTKKEVTQMLCSEFRDSEPMYMEEIEKVFNNLDADGDNEVTFKEFAAIVTDLELMLR